MTQPSTNARLLSRELLNDELAIVRVRPDDGSVPNFLPGQYAELAIPQADSTERLVRRSYSIASAPSTREYLEFYLVLVPGGHLTPSLWSLKPGDPLWLGPKIKGKFTLEDIPAEKDFVMVATGTGLAPYVSMIREYKDSPRWRRFILVHGVRYERDLGYRSELEQLAKHYEHFYYLPTLTREEVGSEWTGHRGRVHSVFESGYYDKATGTEFKSENCQVFLCGNPEMIDSMQSFLEARSFREHSKKNPGNIHVERYW